MEIFLSTILVEIQILPKWTISLSKLMHSP
jgi:hypothetical protein